MPDPSVPIVSIVIPVRNESRALAAMLKAMADLNWPKGSRELILVDNASFDSSGALLKKAGGGGAEEVGESRRGSYAVRNAETAIAGGEIPAFTDTDCRPERDWLVKGADILRRHGLDTVTGKVRQVSPARRTLFDIVDQSIYVQTSLFRKLSGEQGFQGSKSLPERGRERRHVGVAADADAEEMDLKAGDFFLPVGNQHGKRDGMRGVADGIELSDGYNAQDPSASDSSKTASTSSSVPPAVSRTQRIAFSTAVPTACAWNPSPLRGSRSSASRCPIASSPRRGLPIPSKQQRTGFQDFGERCIANKKAPGAGNLQIPDPGANRSVTVFIRKQAAGRRA